MSGPTSLIYNEPFESRVKLNLINEISEDVKLLSTTTLYHCRILGPSIHSRPPLCVLRHDISFHRFPPTKSLNWDRPLLISPVSLTKPKILRLGFQIKHDSGSFQTSVPISWGVQSVNVSGAMGSSFRQSALGKPPTTPLTYLGTLSSHLSLYV